MEETKLYIVPGYNMTQDDVDGLANYCASIAGISEFDNITVVPIMRNKKGERVNRLI